MLIRKSDILFSVPILRLESGDREFSVWNHPGVEAVGVRHVLGEPSYYLRFVGDPGLGALIHARLTGPAKRALFAAMTQWGR